MDIDAGAELVRRIRGAVEATHRPEVLGGLGGFAGLCRLPERYRDPVLVSGTDGVGTKLKTAFATGRHDTVGVDLVAMAVNDILVVGAEPLFFLDYYATGALEVDIAEAVVRGIAAGCQEAGCALLGGETAELPGFYGGGEYDLAGFCVGVVERDEIRDGADLAAGDVLVGLPSSGLHSNGHSLARKALISILGLPLDSRPEALGGAALADALLEPTRIYARAFADLAAASVRFHAASHITGGGLVENPPRMLPGDALACRLDTATWEVPAIFGLIASAGVDEAEMRRTFNLGLGMVIAVAEADADAAIAALAAHDARAVGAVVARGGGEAVRFDG